MQGFFCPRCERRMVVPVNQEPYGDGKRFVAKICWACGWSLITRDDFAPQNVGREGTPSPEWQWMFPVRPDMP